MSQTRVQRKLLVSRLFHYGPTTAHNNMDPIHQNDRNEAAIAPDQAQATDSHGLPVSTVPKETVLGTVGAFMDSDQVVLLLTESPPLLEVRKLAIYVKTWTSDLKDAIISCLTKSSSLRSLTIRVYYSDGSRQAPEDLVAALDTGTRCLETVDFDGAMEHWSKPMLPSLMLNRFRHFHGHVFESIGRSESEQDNGLRLVQALELTDLVTLAKLLRRNEWNLQGLLQHYGLPDVDAGRPSKRLCRDKSMNS